MSHPEPWQPEPPGVTWRRRLIKAACAAGLLVACILGYDWYDSWRYSRLIETAKNSSAAADWETTSFALRRAAQIRPGEVEPLVLLAEMAEKVGHPDAINLRLAVAMANQGSMKYRFDLVRTALKLGDVAGAVQALATIDRNAHGTPTYLALKAQVDIAAGNRSSAEAAALEAVRLDPANPHYRFHLANAQLGSTNASVREAARKSMEEAAAIPEFRRDAIRLLSVDALNRRDTVTARRWVEEIVRGGNTDFGDEIQQLELLRIEKSPALAPRLESIQRRASTNLQSISTLASWMMGTGSGKEASQWLASLGTNLVSHPSIQNLRIQSHLVSKDVKGCIRWLNSETWGANDHSRLLWLARLNHIDKQESVAKAAWNKARTAGGNNPQARRQLWQLAIELGWKDEATQILQATSMAPSDSRWAQLLLFDQYMKQKRTPQMLEVSERILRASPDDWFAKNNVAAFSLLLNTNLPLAAKLASEAIAARPNDPLVTATHAFALQKTGKLSDALLVYGRIPDAVRSKPGVAVYYASALVESGRITEARKYLTLADDPSLLPEERSLLNASLRKAAQSPPL